MTLCLIVDDSVVIRKFIKEILEKDFSFTTTEAENGIEALKLCKEQIPNLLMLDWNMPKMNGLDFLKAFRQLPGNDQTIVIICSTENEISKIEKGLSTGANEFIMKPFDSAILKTKFEQLGIIR